MRTHVLVWMVGGLAVAALTGGGAALAVEVERPVVTAVSPASGPVTGGHVVTLTGAGFVVGETSVAFDGADVQAVVQSPTTLTFVAPPHDPGRVKLWVRAGDFSSESRLDYLIESPPPSAAPAAATPTATPTPTSVTDDEVVRSDRPDPRPSTPPSRAHRPEHPLDVADEPRPDAPTLAATGSSVGERAGIGVLAVLLGAVLVVLGRDRPAGEPVRR